MNVRVRLLHILVHHREPLNRKASSGFIYGYDALLFNHRVHDHHLIEISF